MSFMLLSFAVVLLTWVGIGLYKLRSKYSAPGPYGVPIVGYYPFLLKNSGKVIQKLAKKYGDIFCLNILGREFYFLNSFEVIKEAFVTKSEFTSGRPHGYNSMKLLIGNAFSLVDGPQWYAQRKLFFKALGALGVGKSALESKVTWQCEKLVSQIEATKGKDYDFFDDLTLFTTNVMSDLLFSKEYEKDNPDYICFKKVLQTFAACFPELEILYSGPLYYFTCLARPKNVKALQRIYKQNHEYVLKVMNERLIAFQEGQTEDILDFYIQSHLQEIREGTEPQLFTKNSIADSVIDNFLGGGEMPTAVLYYALFMMVERPEVQQSVHEEIGREIGCDRSVTMADKTRLHYTLAVLSELERLVEVLPFGISRTALCDLNIANYRVPKGANLIGNLACVMKSPRYFKNPRQFDPSNFLNEDGKYTRNPANIAFSVGSRSCVGFMIAQVEWFICFVTLIQKFQWCEPTETVRQPLKEKNEGVPRIDGFKIRAIRRYKE